MSNRIETMYSDFMKKSSSNICNYFDLQDKNLDIQLSQKDAHFLLHVKYNKKIKYIQFRDLPEEINREINSYLFNYIHMNCKLIFDKNYPFSPPIWSLYSIKYNWDTVYDIDIPEYYKYIIQTHNNGNNKDYWSPAITLEKDCLDLIVKLNNFEYFF